VQVVEHQGHWRLGSQGGEETTHCIPDAQADILTLAHGWALDQVGQDASQIGEPTWDLLAQGWSGDGQRGGQGLNKGEKGQRGVLLIAAAGQHVEPTLSCLPH
jgi:hypothetical protein